ncbi:GATA zinc finger domain-containing protein 1 [Cryptotermes secundus]|uniref:GATA zinc finger domain-containing protein 1 n=1 Tax=Cryptotermes secundus TaxID=105785 RepID=UPI000CD7AAA3|nr:GATA zinc finger domain-containing protein 1 [Cryptotermes secundus]
MPLGIKPECVKCQKTECTMWKNTPEGKLCNDCFNFNEKNSSNIKVEEPVNACKSGPHEAGGPKIATRKSTRNTRSYKTRLNPYALPKPVAPKGKGRRVIFKKCCTKAPAAVATPVTSDYVFYKGSYFQVGDIVSMRDVEGGLYYAQIRGLLTDQYCEKSCVVTWLLPTQESPNTEEGFDPATYIIGPEEDIPRKLECVEFVMHAPSDYFKARNTPFPPTHVDGSESNFIWTRLAPQMRST